MIDYCIVSSDNGMVFNFLPSWILAFFDKTCNFFPYFLTFSVIIQDVWVPGPAKLMGGWKMSYWKILSCHGIGFDFWISQFLCNFLLTKFAFFPGFWKFLSFFKFFQLQGPSNLLWGLLIEHFIVSSNIGMVFNI